jgi:tripartite-type tricarboxylate transporter receptor subunit TctC
MAMLIGRAGLKMTAVTYKGAGPAMIDLLAGRVHLKVDSGDRRGTASSASDTRTLRPQG